MNFRSEEEVDHFLDQFRHGTLPLYCWTHAAHVAMCAAVLWDGTPIEDIGAGIRHYSGSRGLPASAYHETLTRFWIETVRDHMHNTPFPSRLEAVQSSIRQFGLDSKRPAHSYTFDVFHSPDARARWIPPDIPGNHKDRCG